MSMVDELERLSRLQHHNATTTEQRQEVVKRFAEGLLSSWDGDCSWQTLGQFLSHWVGDVESLKDTEIVCAIEGAGYVPGAWETFPEDSDEWKAELVRRYNDTELRHTVDENELRAKGLIK